MTAPTVAVRRRRWASAVVALGVVAVGCGGDDDSSGTDAEPSTTASPITSSSPSVDETSSTTGATTATTAAATTSTTSTTSTAAPPTTTPASASAALAEVDVGADGEPVALGVALDPAEALAETGMQGMPAASGATVIGIRMESNATFNDSHNDDQVLLFAARTTVRPEEIAARFQAAVTTIGEYTIEGPSEYGYNEEPITGGFTAIPAGDGLPTAEVPAWGVLIWSVPAQGGVTFIQVVWQSRDTAGALPPVPAYTSPLTADAVAFGANRGGRRSVGATSTGRCR